MDSDYNFKENIFDLVKKIPKGKVVTYKSIAKKLKKPNASRAVGNALNKNTNLIKVPCHRVVKSTGEIGGYAKGTKNKIELLKKEGVIVKNTHIDLNVFEFHF